METITVESIDIFVNHHGVLGQKHGVKNGPPYPLEEGDHSSSEESAAKKAGISVGTSSGKGSLDNVESANKKETSDKKESSSDTSQKKPTKEDIVNSGDIKLIQSSMKDLNLTELQTAMAKRSLMIQVNKTANPSTVKKLQETTQTLKDVSVSAENVISFYNTGAKILNSLTTTTLPIISSGTSNKAKKAVSKITG
jgi:hypothetical protein